MDDIITTSNIQFIIMIAGVVFAIYRSYSKPQEETETKLAVGEERDKNKATILAQKETDSKAALLDQQVKLERESNEKKFADFGKRLDESSLLAANHIHTVDTKVDVLTKQFGELTVEVAKLATIIDERIPKKVV